MHDQRSEIGVKGASHRPVLRSRLRKVLATASVLIAVFAVLTAGLFVWPHQGGPARVDAIVMLAGPGDRVPAALVLAREHRAPVLVVSRGWMGYSGQCPPSTPGVKTICFEPNPGNTRGEAEYVSTLARREGWHSLLVVAIRPQAIRSQLLFGRCFVGRTYISTASIPASSWPFQIAYGWGALVKAVFLARGC